MIEFQNVDSTDIIDVLNEELSALWEYAIEISDNYVMCKCQKFETIISRIRCDLA